METNANPETILVVDDSAEIQSFLCGSVLEPAGYRVLSAYDGNAGLAMAIEHKPDLILMDISMPGDKCGLDVLKELKQRGYTMPVIIMTSFRSEEVILQSLRLGAKDFLHKPFTYEDVLATISNVLAETIWMRERAHVNRALNEANLKLQEQLKAWATLNMIGQAITSTLEETDVRRRLMWGINRLLRVEAGSLFLIDEESNELVLEISLGGILEKESGLRLKMGQGIAGWVAENNQAALVPDVRSDQRFFPNVDLKTGFVTRSVLAVPLTIKDKVLGVIQVLNPMGSKKRFDENDQKLLEALAASVAVAVENARLHAKMRQTVTVETLKQTVVTLSHYINNSLTVLVMVAEDLRDRSLSEGSENGLERLQETADTIYSESHRIATILKILDQVTSPRAAIYEGETRMIDIEPELRAALSQAKNTDERSTLAEE
jgi:DNA-binding response OmpR family regulator/putative methionine-R-sulfoxide reductase with GAF domain